MKVCLFLLTLLILAVFYCGASPPISKGDLWEREGKKINIKKKKIQNVNNNMYVLVSTERTVSATQNKVLSHKKEYRM